jgi:hypothetical protein
MTYLRQARFTGTPEGLSKDMKEAVDSLLEARVKIRKIHEALSSIASDASGITFTDNYDDPEIRRVAKVLYELDHQIGEGFQSIEKMDRDLKKKVKKASDYTYDRTAKEAEPAPELKEGQELVVTMRMGSWPPDMFNKGTTFIVKSVDGDKLMLKEKGHVMSLSDHAFRVSGHKNGVFTLESSNDRFKRGLKVKLKG